MQNLARELDALRGCLVESAATLEKLQRESQQIFTEAKSELERQIQDLSRNTFFRIATYITRNKKMRKFPS
jgi:ribosomal protein S17E